VQGEIGQFFVPFRVDPATAVDLARRWGALWTPTVLFLDADQALKHRVVGYHSADDFIVHLYFARGRGAFDQGRWEEAILRFKLVWERYGRHELAPEALYWLAASKYRKSGKPEELRSGWKHIESKYPESGWARRVRPFIQ
jgi:TolA-binding protein